MTKLIISFSADIEELRNSNLFNPVVSAKFPGAMWISCLKEQALWPLEFVTADVALARVKANSLKASDILVVQHNVDTESDALIAAGASLFLTAMFESPLYAAGFYESIPRVSERSRWVMTFDGLSPSIRNNIPAYFPSFGVSDLLGVTPRPSWKDLRHACMVVGNKYVITKPPSFSDGLEYGLWWLAKSIRQGLVRGSWSSSYRYASCQLQDKRLEVIEEMFKRDRLDLFGAGWDKLYRLPPTSRKKLAPLLSNRLVAPIRNKRECLSLYKFNICFENLAAPGYITEKIFDAMLACAVPVYLGAPNIGSYVPVRCFIDASRFSNMRDLAVYLETVSEGEAMDIIRAGQQFLRSEAGLQYSYESMASRVADKISRVLNDETG